jgi:hypothetical protein
MEEYRLRIDTAAHFTVAAFWLTLFHINLQSLRSLPVDCQSLSLLGHSFRCSSARLTVHCHEPWAQYGLYVTLVWAFVHPSPSHEIHCPVTFCYTPTFPLVFQAIIVISPVLQCCRSQLHTLLYLPIKIPVVAANICLPCTSGHYPFMD